MAGTQLLGHLNNQQFKGYNLRTGGLLCCFRGEIRSAGQYVIAHVPTYIRISHGTWDVPWTLYPLYFRGSTSSSPPTVRWRAFEVSPHPGGWEVSMKVALTFVMLLSLSLPEPTSPKAFFHLHGHRALLVRQLAAPHLAFFFEGYAGVFFAEVDIPRAVV